MPEARKKNMFKVLAGAVLAAALVVTPLVTAGASAKEPELKGEVGQFVPWKSKMNQTQYWEDLYDEFDARCYKSDRSTDHGWITDRGKTVTLKPFQDSWPGDRWQLLVIKGGSKEVNVVELPRAGVAYASPRNNGGKQADVSHWIVCKGTTPQTPPKEVVPTLTLTDPSCEAAGLVSRSENADWTSVDNGDGTTTWTAVPKQGTVFPVGDYSWIVPTDLSKLPADSEACRGPQPEPEVTSVVSFRYHCADTTVTVTTVTTTTPYVWTGKQWELGEGVDVTDVTTRAMTDAEKAATDETECLLPETTVEYGAWQDGTWECGDTTVAQTREVTTTVYEFDGQNQPVAKSSVAIETQTRDLTQDEISECPLIPGDIRSVCVGDVPYLGYELTLPEGFVPTGENPVTITFVNPDGDDHVVGGQPLSGSLLWPGASADEPMMWPGWDLVDGEYVPTDGNFAWTRGTAENPLLVRFDVNPSYTTEIVYPEATALCANPPAGTGEEGPGEEPVPPVDEGESTPGEQTTEPGAGSPAGTPSSADDALAVTGGGLSPLVAVGGGAVLAAGIAVVLIVAHRRRTGVQ